MMYMECFYTGICNPFVVVVFCFVFLDRIRVSREGKWGKRGVQRLCGLTSTF